MFWHSFENQNGRRKARGGTGRTRDWLADEARHCSKKSKSLSYIHDYSCFVIRDCRWEFCFRSTHAPRLMCYCRVRNSALKTQDEQTLSYPNPKRVWLFWASRDNRRKLTLSYRFDWQSHNTQGNNGDERQNFKRRNSWLIRRRRDYLTSLQY